MRAMPLAAVPAAGVVLLLSAAGPAAADGSASPSPSPSASSTVTTAGTSFLTATTVRPGQSAKLSASTGDYLYWSFAAAAGQTDRVEVTITLPPAASRHGNATWTVEAFDGLRRRQACTAGAQTVTAATGDTTVSLGCTLRQVRSWAESWSGDPLPGTYYLRLSATDLPEPDLGLPIQTDLRITAQNGDAQPDGATLKAPLSPPVNPGATLAPDAVPSSAPSAAASAPRPVERAKGWFSSLSTRWLWTTAGGVLAAVAGVAGYSLTRHPRRWFSTAR
ncbi:peptidase [Streptantibioticus ferralitis]|uniref:Peptidase n=1 Tax=Streptantibioticus ferralitis TaxID=236510 RepID=A0ABT5YWB2_9ACTN|nr:peptidase [Streptantibioticus ferralitis]MDF2255882.1 peptidase [Streptantibioticus ferralitis]